MHRRPLAVAPAGRRVLGRPVPVVDAEGRAVPGALLHHLRDGGVVQLQAVLDRVAAAVERPAEPHAVVGVAGDLLSPAVRLVDDGPQLFDGERRLGCEIPLLVHPRAVGHVDLDPVGAALELLARRLARLDGPVDELGAAGQVHELRRVSFERISAGGGDGTGRREDPRPRDVAAIHRLLDADVAVARALGLHVSDGGEALLERAAGRDRGASGAKRDPVEEKLAVVAALARLLTLQEEMGMRVDEAGQERRIAEVDDLGPLGSAPARAHRGDAVSLDDDEGRRGDLVGAGVEEARGLDDDGRGCRCESGTKRERDHVSSLEQDAARSLPGLQPRLKNCTARS